MKSGVESGRKNVPKNVPKKIRKKAMAIPHIGNVENARRTRIAFFRNFFRGIFRATFRAIFRATFHPRSNPPISTVAENVARHHWDAILRSQLFGVRQSS